MHSCIYRYRKLRLSNYTILLFFKPNRRRRQWTTDYIHSSFQPSPSNQAAEGGNGQLTTFILPSNQPSPSNQAAEGGNGQLTTFILPSNQAAEGGNGQLTTFILPSNQAAEGGNGQLTIDNGRLTPHHDSAHSPSLLFLLTSPYSATSNLGPS